jgi:hypothetical protein
MYTTTFRLPDPLNGTGFSDLGDGPAHNRSWKSSEYVCAFSDDERHLGHVIKSELWDAYDATRLNGAAGGFKYLGAFGDLATAMQAVERSVERKQESRTMHAGAGVPWNHIF